MQNGKQIIKFGKFISSIIKIVNLQYDNVQISSSIEKIVDEYKSWYKTNNKLEFVILRGEEILKGYNYEYQYSNSNSPLHRSCMNNKFNLLDLYTNNEDKVLLLTLQNSNKIYGRCLIWKLDKPKIIYMDRVYGVDNYVNCIFEDFARINK
jgi:hypothetical protein